MDGVQNGSDVHDGRASSAEEEHVIQASTYALWEQLYAPARVPLTLERLLYLRLSAKGDGESNDAEGRRYGTNDLQWAEALFGEIDAQPGASTLSASMVPSTTFATVTRAPAAPSRGATSVAKAMTEPLHENGEAEEKPQQAWRESLPGHASSVAAQPTPQCTAADVEHASVSMPLSRPRALPDSPLSRGPGWKADTAAPVQVPPQLEQRHQQPLTSSAKAAEATLQHVTQTCVNALSATTAGGEHAPEQRRAATTIPYCGTFMAPAPESSPPPAQCHSGGSHDVRSSGGGGDDSGAILLRPCRGRAMSAASPPDLVLPASTSDVPLPSATPLSLVSAASAFDTPAAQAVGMRKETAVPLSLDRDDSDDHTDRNEEALLRDDTWWTKAACTAQALSAHTSPTLAATVRVGKEDHLGGAGSDADCSLPSESSACRDDDAEGRSAIDDEEKHARESCGAWEHGATTTAPVPPQHQYLHRSLRGTEPSVEGGPGYGGDGPNGDDDVGFLSLTTAPAGVPEPRRSRHVGGICAAPLTPSLGPVGMLKDAMTAPAISVLPGSLQVNEEDKFHIDSPTRRAIAAGVSTPLSPVEGLNGLVLTPSPPQQMPLPLQHRRPRQPSQQGEGHSHLLPVTESPSRSLPPPPSCGSTPHVQECCPRASQTPPTPAGLLAAAMPPPASPAKLADSSAGTIHSLCAADTAPLVIRQTKREAMAAMPSIPQEGRTSAVATVNVNGTAPRNGTVLESPVGASLSAGAAKDSLVKSDGGQEAPVAVAVEEERVSSDEADEGGDAEVSASMGPLSRRWPPLALPTHCGGSALADGMPEGHGGCVSSTKKAAGGNDGEAVRAANGASVSVAAAPVTRFTTTPSPLPHPSHGSLGSAPHEAEHQQRQQKPLPEETAARRSVSSMDFRWADEVDDVLRRQQLRLRSLQAARAATPAGGDGCRSPSTSGCCPVGGPRCCAPLSQDGRSAPVSQDGNGAVQARRHGGSEAPSSVSPQPQDPRAYAYPKGARMMGPGGRGAGAVAPCTNGSGIVTELRDVVSPSHRADRSKELASLNVSRSGEGGAAGALASASASPPPTAQLRQPTLAAVAAAIAADDAPALRTGRQHQPQQPSPQHAGAKRLRESRERDDDSSDPVRTLRSPAPPSVSVPDGTTKTKTKSNCSGDAPSVDPPRRRQRLRGGAADKATSGALLSASPANVFALPRTVSPRPGASVAAAPPTQAAPLPLLRSRIVNGANPPASAAQAPKSAKGRVLCAGATSPAVTAATQPPRANVSTRTYKRAPSLVPLRKRKEE
ncbi:hypothetical protein LSCM1_07451 [Leishmania martiniquensis]|uniref:Uncharacterized protein n=1 Tax=Leishmania martiniquensis TaxID=1580590 RepID=A0A836HZZ0_9TRYP|nr:hypothetical protein LSCM1_07451 [Leishmania martiniquensis]